MIIEWKLITERKFHKKEQKSKRLNKNKKKIKMKTQRKKDLKNKQKIKINSKLIFLTNNQKEKKNI